MFKTSLVLAALATVTALPAHAQDAPRTAKVSWSDLDLSSSDGRAELQRRVRSAASRVCNDDSIKGAASASRAAACRANALSGAQAQLTARAPVVQVASR